MTERPFCQSCGMPMDVPGSEYGTERDGTRSRDYCSYCYRDGAFTTDWTMEEMIEFCVGPLLRSGFTFSQKDGML